MYNNSIEKIRKRIDKIDNRILRLIVKRYFLVKNIGKIKGITKMPVVNKDREKQILERILKLSDKVETKDYIESIYRAIFNASYEIEEEK